MSLELESITETIIGAGIEVHRELGPGLLESAYQHCLCRELSLRGVEYKAEVELPLRYKGAPVGTSYRIDLLVAESVIVELKAVDRMLPVHEAQLLTYLRLTGMKVGLLINFNVPVLVRGITRRVL